MPTDVVISRYDILGEQVVLSVEARWQGSKENHNVNACGQFIDVDDIRWRHFLKDTRHDFYHIPEYVESCARYEGAVATAFYAESSGERFLAPLLLRRLPRELGAPSEWRDCVSPYGYSTPLASDSQSQLPEFLNAFCRAGREHGIVTAFFRLHPHFVLDPAILLQHGLMFCHGQTVSMDLGVTPEEQWQRFSTNHQRNIKKLRKLGFTVSLDEWSRLPEFIEIYHATMRRVEAEQGYFFSGSYFQDLRFSLGDRLHLISVLSETNEVAAAGLFVVTGDIVQYHLGGTASAYMALSPSKLLIDFAWRWAQEQACRLFHLGGGVGGAEDSLFRFKAGFSSKWDPFYSFRMILDTDRNRTLELAAGYEKVCDDDKLLFFPRYRMTARPAYLP